MIPRLSFSMSTMLALGSCAQNGGEAAVRRSRAVDDTPMGYTKVDTPNPEGFAKVSMGSGGSYAEGIIDAKGVEIIPPMTSMLIDDITGSTALVRRGREHLFVDLGNGPVDPDLFATTKGYQYAEPFRCGRAMVQVDDRRFYIDSHGNRLFGASYDHAESFHHDRAMVKEGERYRIIDTTGNTVAPMNYDQVSSQSPWCWQVTRIRGEAYWSGFVDLNGKEITPLIYDEVGYYDPVVMRIRVGKDGKYGFLDEHARVVIPVQYEYAEIFDNGKARVILNGRGFLSDPDGKEVME